MKPSEILRENAHKHTQIKHQLCGEGNECCAMGLMGLETGLITCETLTSMQNSASPAWLWADILIKKVGVQKIYMVEMPDGQQIWVDGLSGLITEWNDSGLTFLQIAEKLEALGL